MKIGSIKEIRKEKQKRKSKGGRTRERAVDTFLLSITAEWERFNRLRAQSPATSPINPRLIFSPPSRYFHLSSVTSGWGEKPSPERNKVRNGGITESLTEFPEHILSAVRVSIWFMTLNTQSSMAIWVWLVLAQRKKKWGNIWSKNIPPSIMVWGIQIMNALQLDGGVGVGQYDNTYHETI